MSLIKNLEGMNLIYSGHYLKFNILLAFLHLNVIGLEINRSTCKFIQHSEYRK